MSTATGFRTNLRLDGKTRGEMSGAFSCDVKKHLKPGVKNKIAVRVTHRGFGGNLLAAHAPGTQDECSTEQLDKYRY